MRSYTPASNDQPDRNENMALSASFAACLLMFGLQRNRLDFQLVLLLLVLWRLVLVLPSSFSTAALTLAARISFALLFLSFLLVLWIRLPLPLRSLNRFLIRVRCCYGS